MISTEHRGSLYAILSGFLYGFVGYFGISVIHADISVSNMLFWRFLISSVVMFLFILPKLKRIKDSWSNILLTFVNGAIFYSISTMLYFFACRYIGSGLAMVIFFTYPVMVILINYFFYKQHIPNVYYFAIAIILLGMFLFVDINEMKLDLMGVTLGIISALFYAGYIVSSKKSNISPDMSAFMVSLGCMMTSLLFTVANNTLYIPTSWGVWGNLLGIGVVATAVPILLLLYSLKYINSERASILSVLEPVFVVIFGVVLLGETLKWQHGIGVIMVLSGALLTLFSHRIHFGSLERLGGNVAKGSNP